MAIAKADPNADMIYGTATVLNGVTTSSRTLTAAPTLGSGATASLLTLEGRYRDQTVILPEIASASWTNVASGADAVVTIAAQGAARSVLLEGISWGLSAAPSGGNTVSIESPSGTTIFGPMPITQSGPGFHPFDGGFRTPADTPVLVRVKGSPGVLATVSLMGWKKL